MEIIDKRLDELSKHTAADGHQERDTFLLPFCFSHASNFFVSLGLYACCGFLNWCGGC